MSCCLQYHSFHRIWNCGTIKTIISELSQSANDAAQGAPPIKLDQAHWCHFILFSFFSRLWCWFGGPSLVLVPSFVQTFKPIGQILSSTSTEFWDDLGRHVLVGPATCMNYLFNTIFLTELTSTGQISTVRMHRNSCCVILSCLSNFNLIWHIWNIIEIVINSHVFFGESYNLIIE